MIGLMGRDPIPVLFAFVVTKELKISFILIGRYSYDFRPSRPVLILSVRLRSRASLALRWALTSLTPVATVRALTDGRFAVVQSDQPRCAAPL